MSIVVYSSLIMSIFMTISTETALLQRPTNLPFDNEKEAINYVTSVCKASARYWSYNGKQKQPDAEAAFNDVFGKNGDIFNDETIFQNYDQSVIGYDEIKKQLLMERPYHTLYSEESTTCNIGIDDVKYENNEISYRTQTKSKLTGYDGMFIINVNIQFIFNDDGTVKSWHCTTTRSVSDETIQTTEKDKGDTTTSTTGIDIAEYVQLIDHEIDNQNKMIEQTFMAVIGFISFICTFGVIMYVRHRTGSKSYIPVITKWDMISSTEMDTMEEMQVLSD